MTSGESDPFNLDKQRIKFREKKKKKLDEETLKIPVHALNTTTAVP